MQLKTVLRTLRPSFLVLTPVCVFLGLSTALATQSSIDYFLGAVVLIGAMAAHISVNTLNEYHDFKSGLDLTTERTSFSGGSGALPEHPELAEWVLIIGLVFLAVTVVIGIYLVMERGVQILPIGIVGVVLVVTYTQWLNRYPFLCLIAPGLGFGVLMIAGTYVILTGGHSPLPWLVSLVPFFLINNLLLLNQYPDIEADAGVGRKTFPIAFGLRTSNYVYTLFMTAAYALILLYIVRGYIPGLGIIALIPAVLSLFAWIGAINFASNIGDYPQYLGANVAAAILTPLLLGVSILYG
ncbi:MAG: prenyltransferase [Gammaproteobacteria bacterium]|nr:prenyltransferase [Gammaproteobacteria bacterium]